MSEAILRRLRALCLAFPEATEKQAWGTPTFRVRDKLFAMWDDHHHGVEHVAIWCKAPGGVQEILVGAAPQRFFVPPYVGHKGWIGVRLDVDVDWDEVRDLLQDSYLMTAPKKIAAQLQAPRAGAPPALPANSEELDSGPSRRPQKKGPPQGERKKSFKLHNPTVRPEEPPPE